MSETRVKGLMRYSTKGNKIVRPSRKPKKKRRPQGLANYWKTKCSRAESTEDSQRDNSSQNTSRNQEEPHFLSMGVHGGAQERELKVPNITEPQNENLHFDQSMYTKSPDTLITTNSKLTPISTYSLQGRRIINLKYFVEQIISMDDHLPFHCSFKDMDPKREIRRGLNSGFMFKCRLCGLESMLWTDIPDNSVETLFMDVNSAAVSGTMSTGGGHAQLDEMMSTMNIPCMSSNTFKKYHDRLGDEWEKAAQCEMEDAVKLEIEEAKKRGHIAADGTPLLTVAADGSWGKRSYRNNYSSLSGVAAIIGFYTRKVLYIGVKNKFCTTCTRSKNKGVDPHQHVCSKNWDLSSTSMEAAVIVEGFLVSEAIYGVRYAKLVADGDSSVYKKILDARPYKTMTVEKVECRNHLLRNYCNKIRDIVTTSDGGRFPVMLRKKIGNNTLRLRTAVSKAIQYRKKQDAPLEKRMDELRKDILNGPSHVLGDHSKCKERGYFCQGKNKPNEFNLIPDLIKVGLFEKVLAPSKYLAQNSRSLIQDVDSNAAEQYNGAVAKFIGGKRINFSLSGSYKVRCVAAVVQHNTGKAHYVLHKSIYGRSPGRFCKESQMKRKLKVDSEKERRRKKPKLARSLFCEKGSQDQDYGANVQRPDMSVEEFQREKDQFLISLRRTKEEREALERLTILQRESGEWLEQRRKLLTASNFGTVCKRRADTGCEKLVKQMLYSSELQSQSIMYGQIKEGDAINDLEKKESVKVVPCGLFLDRDIPYLGASPDGLIGEDGIVEVKCPFSAAEMTPEEAVLAGKIQVFKENKGELVLNKRHNYFYQIQGQLHITQRKYCLLVVWTKKGMVVKRVEKDDDFWKIEMESKLTRFYLDCILPELIDPRHTRSMKIRNPEYILNAQNSKTK